MEWGLLILAVTVIFLPKPKHTSLIRLWMSIILALLLTYIWSDGPRWQMIPIYIVLLTAAVVPLLSPYLSPFIKRIDRSIAMLLILVGLLAGTLFPIVEFEPLDGTYQVGTLAYELVDDERQETFVYSAEMPRQLRMQVWYPAYVTNEPLAPYSDDIHIGGARWMRRIGLPQFLPSHVSLINARAYAKPPLLIKDAPYPVLMFVGGIGGQRTQNSLLFEHLASEGYIVVAADHPFYSGYTLFPDGSIATHWPRMFDPESADGGRLLSEMTTVLAGDLDLMLETLSDLNSRPFTPFTQRLNLDQVGVFGHSTGATAAALFCQQDLRCKAYLGLDPWLIPASDELVTNGLPQPLMVIRGMDAISELNKPRLLRLAYNSHDRHYEAILEQARHLDFTDYRTFSPLLRWGGLVSGNAARNAEIVQTYTQAFFDHELRGWGGALLFIDSAEFPEATIKTHR